MGKTKKARNIILTALITILCGSAALTAYAENKKGEKPVLTSAVREAGTGESSAAVQEAETGEGSASAGQGQKTAMGESKPALPVEEEKTMFGRQYTLKGLTAGGAGIYANPENDRARDYVIAALDEAGIDNTMTDYDKVVAINDYLCKKLKYVDYAAEEGFSYKEDWIPYTDYCLLSDSAVCAGYADAFQSMAICCGIECWYVTGNVYQNGGTEGIYHAWNRVVLDGKSQYIDVCWNDSPNHAYFLSANGWEDHKMEGEHETYGISGQMFPMPE